MTLFFIHYLLLWFWVYLVLTVKFSLTICSNVIVHSNHRKQIYFLTADLEISYCIVQSCCLQQCPSTRCCLTDFYSHILSTQKLSSFYNFYFPGRFSLSLVEIFFLSQISCHIHFYTLYADSPSSMVALIWSKDIW